MSKENVLEALRLTSKTKTGVEPYPEISIKEFLDFLRTAYQVHDTVESLLLSNGMTEAVDWLKLKESKLVRPAESAGSIGDGDRSAVERRRSDANVSTASADQSDAIKRKLSEVLSEGLLDSVLPHLVPSSGSSRRSSVVKVNSERTLASASNVKTKLRSGDNVSKASVLSKTESEVEIHVCDEVKKQKKDFVCNQTLLIEKMGYFAEVTTGQKLEDMDISVHCDIGIFEWLMNWVKKDTHLAADHPQLDAQCVIPILVSAAFLQMEPLQTDCLLYCHAHMSEILRTNTNLACLNDTILTRLAAMYTNTELESIKDRKDKIQSRLYTKLIQSLAEPEPESVRGHFSSLATLYRCVRCQQLVQNGPSSLLMPCRPACMRLQCDGSIRSHHERDPAWNLNDYIQQLHKSMKTWRRVYWRLWGVSHFMFCTQCKRLFPICEMKWCRYHPDPPQYFTLDAQKAPLPVGRYPCCGERAYRFQLLNDYSGCQFHEHSIRLKDVRETSTLTMFEMFRQLIEEQPPQLLFPERLTRLIARDETNECNGKLVCKENFWWMGFQIVPPRPNLGLLGCFRKKNGGGCNQQQLNEVYTSDVDEEEMYEEEVEEEEEEEESDDSTLNSGGGGSDSSMTSGSEELIATHTRKSISNKSNAKRIKPLKRNRLRRSCGGGGGGGKKKNTGATKLWQNNLSARSNQDIQRSREESSIREMVGVLSGRVGGGGKVGGGGEVGGGGKAGKGGFSRNVTPMGGVWVRLESEWREANKTEGGGGANGGGGGASQQKMRSVFTGKVRPKCPNK